MKLDTLYREVVLDHHRNPRKNRPSQRIDAQASGVNPTCGDEVSLTLQVENDRIVDVGVESHGCAISTASGSMLAETVIGLSTNEAKKLMDDFKRLMRGETTSPDTDLGDLEALAGVSQFPLRVKCAMLPHLTLLEALEQHQGEGAARIITTEEATAEQPTPPPKETRVSNLSPDNHKTFIHQGEKSL